MNVVSAPLKIVQYPHPALRYKARPLTAIDNKVRRVAAEMLALMYENRGLGLAATQVALPYQLLVMNYAGDPEQPDQEGVFLNPAILERKGTMEGEEGCLSFPGLFQKVRRARTVKVQAYNLEGHLLEMELSELPARIWQHEVDHLSGELFIDKMGPIGKLASRSTLREFERQHRKAQEKGELAADEELVRRMRELEAQPDGTNGEAPGPVM
jgi:peptide deformylase